MMTKIDPWGGLTMSIDQISSSLSYSYLIDSISLISQLYYRRNLSLAAGQE